jgi:hypothetical protein
MRNPCKALPVLLLSLLAGPTGCAQILDLPDTVECGSDDACTTNDNPCVLGECVDGTCAFTLVAEGEVVGALEAGDCQQLVCDGAGTAVTAPDPTDAPADETPGDCKAPACSETGTVVEGPAEDAPADETLGDCKAPACEDGAVVSAPFQEDAPVEDVPGDCLAAACGDNGVLPDDSDVPSSGCAECSGGSVVPWDQAGEACYSGDATELTAPNSNCSSGTWVCSGNVKRCDGETLPAQESCIGSSVGRNEDCDDQTDEDDGEDTSGCGPLALCNTALSASSENCAVCLNANCCPEVSACADSAECLTCLQSSPNTGCSFESDQFNACIASFCDSAC